MNLHWVNSLTGRRRAVLDSVALVLKEYPKTIIEVAGHPDKTGAPEYDQPLSERPTRTMAQYLTGKGIIVVGAGEIRPITSNDAVERRQDNRRVELTLPPLRQRLVSLDIPSALERRED